MKNLLLVLLIIFIGCDRPDLILCESNGKDSTFWYPYNEAQYLNDEYAITNQIYDGFWFEWEDMNGNLHYDYGRRVSVGETLFAHFVHSSDSMAMGVVKKIHE